MSIHQFNVKTIKGESQSLDTYKGKVLLIVNVASECGLTPQYAGLQALYDQFREKGLEILGFPCNQFKGQEPGSHEEILEFCQLNYGVTFPLFAKIEVNGPNTAPLYQYLKANAPNNTNEDIDWNFAKFLVDRDGRVVKRYIADTEPVDLTVDIEKLLG